MSIWAQQLYQLRDIPENKSILESEDFQFYAFCLSHINENRAQCFQDMWALYESLKYDREGFYFPTVFVEFGATDGKTISNTFALENDYDWTGILAEPNPIYRAELVKNRGEEKVIPLAVTPRTGEKVRFHCNPASDLSSTVFDVNHVDSNNIIEVETISLAHLIDMMGTLEVGYISVDTEGTEVEIIESFPFDKYNVFLWSIEHNGDQEKIQRILEIMEPHGYEVCFPAFSRWDIWLRKKMV